MEKEEKKELIFIYNATSGTMNAVLDSLHKTFNPSTYPCELCALTFGTLSMKEEWKEFLDGLPVKKNFLHKDEIAMHQTCTNSNEYTMAKRKFVNT
ncbi:MAG: hypothetical protein M3Q58_15460 [Bacteroidota bacterium]|nr:hypothetical protein [Bacteroidota bacterium]